jgi:mannose/cellobiose epimerase-like protein (N-acyl-D-glucosamine 2-epimerase family)
VRQAARVRDACGVALVYEHYDEQWMPDLAYNADKPDDRFKPWGFQPGHLLEWAKLLLQLDALAGEDDGRGAAEADADRAWRAPTAARFFAAACQGWDAAHGGFVYSLAPPAGAAAAAAAAGGAPLAVANGFKYKWVQLEGAVAAALLARALPADAPFYRSWYARIWAYAFTTMYDHTHGAYFRALTADNKKIDDYKSPPGKVEYHATGACYDIIEALGASAHD